VRTPDIDERQPWFRAKKNGWGWSWPLTWQGWLVLGVYCALVLAGALRYASTKDPTLVAIFVLLTLLLTAICWLTGERPRWRWGDKD
jgi:drug/metabolite transporter (DMT)-like permease